MAKEDFNRKKSIFLEEELWRRFAKCFVWTVALYGAETWTLWWNEQKRLEVFEMWIWRRMERENDRQNRKCSCARKSGSWKNNSGTEKEEKKKLAGPLAKKELPAEACSSRNGKWGKKLGRRRRYQIINNILINWLYEGTKRNIEKRVEWRMLSLQWKICPRAENYDWLIDWSEFGSSSSPSTHLGYILFFP